MADDQDKTEKPSPRRLREAREKGQVAKSAELASLVSLAVFCIALISALPAITRAAAHAITSSIALAGAAPALGQGFFHWLLAQWSPVFHGLLAPVFALVIAAVAANVLQTGPVLTFVPMKPDFSRLNPVQGFKRVFSMRTLWDLTRLLLKLALLIGIMVLLTRSLWPLLLSSGASSTGTIPFLLQRVFSRLTGWLLFALALIAVLDLLFSRREFIRKLRMSRRDVKQEHKQQEGDPAIRSKRRRLAREMLARVKSIARVPSADVIVTNPTHVAVALQYRTRHMLAPVVLAKGGGWLAHRIRRVGARSGVPVVRSPALARALFRQCAIDAPVPAESYAEVGSIYRWVMARPGNRVRA